MRSALTPGEMAELGALQTQIYGRHKGVLE
jgi:hypothetical protein